MHEISFKLNRRNDRRINFDTNPFKHVRQPLNWGFDRSSSLLLSEHFLYHNQGLSPSKAIHFLPKWNPLRIEESQSVLLGFTIFWKWVWQGKWKYQTRKEPVKHWTETPVRKAPHLLTMTEKMQVLFQLGCTICMWQQPWSCTIRLISSTYCYIF